MYAQSLVEYGAVTSALSWTVRELIYWIEDWAAHTTPLTWLVIGAVVVAALALWVRR